MLTKTFSVGSDYKMALKFMK